jgi:hypothetical protein
VKQDAPELPGIAEDQTVPALPQNKVVMFKRDNSGRFDAQLPGHAQMNAQPAAFGKAEEHLFAVRFGTQQGRTAQRGLEGGDVRPSEHLFFGVQLHEKYFLVQTAPPLFSKIFDFGQFGHAAD